MGTLVTSPDRAVLLYTEYKRWSSAVTRKRFKNYKTERFFNTNCRPFFKIISEGQIEIGCKSKPAMIKMFVKPLWLLTVIVSTGLNYSICLRESRSGELFCSLSECRYLSQTSGMAIITHAIYSQWGFLRKANPLDAMVWF